MAHILALHLQGSQGSLLPGQRRQQDTTLVSCFTESENTFARALFGIAIHNPIGIINRELVVLALKL